MSSAKQWFALHTSAGCEKKVTESLTRKGCEYYYPINKTAANPGEIRKISRPLFPCFLFVRTSASDHQHLQKLNGVLNMVYWLGEPAIFRDVEIEMLRRFMHEHETVQLSKIPVNNNEIVKLIGSEVQEQNQHHGSSENKTVQLILPTIGWGLTAEVKKEEAKIAIKALPSPSKFFANFALAK